MLKAESFRTPLVLNQPLEIPSPEHIPLSRDGVLMSSLSNLNDYWRLHSDELGERILASYPPLHSPEDPPSSQLSRLLRSPYPAQSLAILGVAKRWQISRSAHVVAECGAGKTLIALGMMFVHAQGQPFSGIVSPHGFATCGACDNRPHEGGHDEKVR